MLWHSAAFASVLGVCGSLFLLSHDVWEHFLAWLLHADKAEIHARYSGPGEVHQAWNGLAGLVLVLGALAGYIYCRRVVSGTRLARQHRLMISRLVNHPESMWGRPLGVIEYSQPAIYCLPGRKTDTRIFVTEGALAVLTPEHLAAAVAHESAHISARHHAQVHVADTIHAVARHGRLLRRYSSAVRDLVELAADEAAAARCGRVTVAEALLELCRPTRGRAPGALELSGGDQAQRIRRLLTAPQAGRRASRWVVAAGVLAATAPVVVAIMPALTAVGSVHDAGSGGPYGATFVHHP